jgi:Bacteriocin-protection, YdeI or OmpD-Associated/Domain of unknown function (DUF1905)
MRGLQVPVDVADALGGGKRPRVTVTVNGHSWKTRIAIMRGRHLIGLSNANRQTADVAIGETVDVTIELDTTEPTVNVPPDLTAALERDPIARAAFDELSHSRRRAYAHAIDSAKLPETRQRRITKALAELRAASAT